MPARPGVDRTIAAGTPQQNRTESVAWALFVSVISATATAWCLRWWGLAPGTVALLVVPVTFLALHLVIVVSALVSAVFRLGSGGLLWVWVSGYSVIAAWLAFSPGWARLAGWAWLIWVFIHALAWIMGRNLSNKS